MSVGVPDRRLQCRVPVPGVGAELCLDDGSMRRRRIELKDLSLGGARWEDAELVERGTRVTLSIRTRRFFGRSIRLEATIVRHGAGETAGQFLTVANRARLDEFLRATRSRIGRPPSTDHLAAAESAAAFRLLGVELDKARPGETRIVVIASPRGSDGKSSVAAGITAALTVMGRRVLLVDADLYAPTQHLQFVANGTNGVAQLLQDPSVATAAEMVQTTQSGIALLAAGASSDVPGLFTVETTQLLAASLKCLGYPLVVVDSPPLLTSAETLLLSRVADDTILTVRSGRSRERDVRQALELLRRQGTPAAGVILNDHTEPLNVWRQPRPQGFAAPASDGLAGVQDSPRLAEVRPPVHAARVSV